MSPAAEDDILQITRAMDMESARDLPRLYPTLDVRETVASSAPLVFSGFSSSASTFKLYQQINLFIGLSLKLSNIVA